MTATLPTNSTDRLRAVADAIETHEDQWDQRSWFSNLSAYQFDVATVADALEPYSEPPCGTSCCIFGWTVLNTPRDVVRGAVAMVRATTNTDYTPVPSVGFGRVGAILLDMDESLAGELFVGLSAGKHIDGMPEFLRGLADLPPEHRNRDFILDEDGRLAELYAEMEESNENAVGDDE